MVTEPGAYTVAQVAEILQCSEDAVYEACRRGEVPHLKIGRLVRIPRRRFEAWMEAEAKVRAE